MESKPSVSEDIVLHEILPKLPAKSIVRFKCASKTWHSLISQNSWLIEKPGSIVLREGCNTLFFLGHNQSNLVEIDTSYVYRRKPETVVLVRSCHGLVCLKLVYPDETYDLVLWNPVTREVNYLPNREGKVPRKDWMTGYALAFDADSGDHKVVWLDKPLYPVYPFYFVEAQIFSKKSGRWRKLKPLTGIRSKGIFSNEVFCLTVDRAIYWPGHPFSVLSFDVSKEEFRESDGPLSGLTDRSIMDMDNFHFVLIDWKGTMGVVFVEPGAAEIHVWLKNKDTSNNIDSGWTNISTIQPCLGPISFGRVFCGHIIDLSYVVDDDDIHKIILYDLVAQEKRELACLENLWCFDFCEHFHTLISPN